MPQSFNSLFVVLVAAALPSMGVAQDLIIEAGQGGKNASQYAETSGAWTDAGDTERSTAPGLTPAAQCKARKLSGGQDAEARFYPRFSAPGHYCVYLTWPSTANSKQLLYVTRCSGNQSAKSVNQNGVGYHNPANGNKWVYLGEWDFKEGGDDYIAVVASAKETTSNDPNRPGMIYADAVRFTLTPLTPADSAELFPRDRVEMRGLGSSVPVGAAVLLGAAPAKGAAPAAKASAPAAASAAPDVASAASVPMSASPASVPMGAGTVSMPPVPAGGSSAIAWMSNIQDAQRSAAADKTKRLVIYFHSKESQQCLAYDKDLFTDPQLTKLIAEKYFAVQLELEQSSDIATTLGVFRAGTFLVYDSAGNGIKKLQKQLTAAELLQELQF